MGCGWRWGIRGIGGGLILKDEDVYRNIEVFIGGKKVGKEIGVWGEVRRMLNEEMGLRELRGE